MFSLLFGGLRRRLDGNNLIGTLPTELGALTKLFGL
jgi:hypothetical protein